MQQHIKAYIWWQSIYLPITQQIYARYEKNKDTITPPTSSD